VWPIQSATTQVPLCRTCAWDNFKPFKGKLLVVNAMAAAQHHQDAGITRTAVKKWQTGMKLRSLR